MYIDNLELVEPRSGVMVKVQLPIDVLFIHPNDSMGASFYELSPDLE